MAEADAATINTSATDAEHRRNFQAANNAAKHDQQQQKNTSVLPNNQAATAAATKAWSGAWDQVGNMLGLLAGMFFFTLSLIVWPFLTLFNGLRLMAGNLFGGNSQFRFMGASVPLVPPFGVRGMVFSGLTYIWVSLFFILFMTLLVLLGYIAANPLPALINIFGGAIEAIWNVIKMVT